MLITKDYTYLKILCLFEFLSVLLWAYPSAYPLFTSVCFAAWSDGDGGTDQEMAPGMSGGTGRFTESAARAPPPTHGTDWSPGDRPSNDWLR